jgi:hypothetical protein
MAKHDYLQDPTTGKMAGSAAGARRTPSAPAAAPVAFQPEPGASPARVAYLAAMEAREIARHHRNAMSDLVTHPSGRGADYIIFSAEGLPVRTATLDGEFTARHGDPALFAALDEHAPYITAHEGMFDDARMYGGRISLDAAERALPVLKRCGIDGCIYRTGPIGSYPRHSPTTGCHYGGVLRHCMCSRCF